MAADGFTKPTEQRARGPRRQFNVVNERLNCPLKGNIDVESCFYCEWLNSLDLDSESPAVYCSPPRPEESLREDATLRERLSLLELARVLGNVSQACRERGISRGQFYAYRRRYLEQGERGLVPRRASGRRQSPMK